MIRSVVGISPLGSTLVAWTDRGLRAILLGDRADDLNLELARRFPSTPIEPDPVGGEAWLGLVLAQIADPVQSWTAPLDLGGTPWQQRVWGALRAIPAGSTTSYAALAQTIGQPNATRAVAGACARNDHAIVIPCHRVVRADGSLSGYAWGVERKAHLLRIEREAASRALATPERPDALSEEPPNRRAKRPA